MAKDLLFSRSSMTAQGDAVPFEKDLQFPDSVLVFGKLGTVPFVHSRELSPVHLDFQTPPTIELFDE
jgi:hypothetical protein